jgi:2-dehydropantoate 2-reductase
VRVIVFGAGAIGGVIGARLFEHGFEVVLIARGGHFEAIQEGGLRLETPDGARTLPIPVVHMPSKVSFRADDIVLLTTKSQDTAAALGSLAPEIPRDTPVVSAQNGVENERAALRHFSRVYGVCVMCPAAFAHPGVVQAFSSPVTGILDTGRYPNGSDEVAESLAAAFRASTFLSEARTDIMRWKYAKLLMNLGNAIEAICGPAARRGPLGQIVRHEGIACLEAAGIDFVSEEEDAARRADHIRIDPIGSDRRAGGSSWQSLLRRTGTIETDYLNGEIVLLGRHHGIPTPANELLQRLANRMALEKRAPGSIEAAEVLAQLDRGIG